MQKSNPSLKEIMKIPGWGSVHDMEFLNQTLLAHSRLFAFSDFNCLEIGTASGRTACLIGSFTTAQNFTIIDAWELNQSKQEHSYFYSEITKKVFESNFF